MNDGAMIVGIIYSLSMVFMLYRIQIICDQIGKEKIKWVGTILLLYILLQITHNVFFSIVGLLAAPLGLIILSILRIPYVVDIEYMYSFRYTYLLKEKQIKTQNNVELIEAFNDIEEHLKFRKKYINKNFNNLMQKLNEV